MPLDGDVRSVLVLGPGPTVIGQGGELDLLGAAACRALTAEGLRVVVACPNPAARLTDPGLANRTYVEPLTVPVLAQILEAERPDALVPFLGGPSGLGLAYLLDREGVLDRLGVRVLGMSPANIRTVEDGHAVKRALAGGEIAVPDGGIAGAADEAVALAQRIGFPVVVRPAFTVGRTATVYNRRDLEPEARKALDISPVRQVLVERSMAGWKALAIEALRDGEGRARTLIAAESIEPLGVNLGDAPIVVPAQTISAAALARCAATALRVLERLGVVGAAGVQFAVHPGTEEATVLDVAVPLSRMTALAARVTGLPVAEAAVRLALGRGLDEVLPAPGDARGGLVFCRVPRFTYENFPAADRRLSTSMKSVGEAIGVGRDLGEALQKALRALDERRGGLGFDEGEAELAALSTERLRDALREPTAARLLHVRHALDRGISEDEVQGLTGIDRRFLVAIRKIGERAAALRSVEGRDALAAIDPDLLRAAKREGFADAQIAYLTRTGERFVRETRARLGIRPAPRALAADGRARDLAYDDAECAAPPAGRSVVVLGGGPARIGQGPELATVCAGVAGAVRAAGVRCVVVDPNPASVATDAPYADALYVVPLTVEDVLEVVRAEHPEGVIVQVGGPTARRLAAELAAEGVPILGTAPDAIDRAEDHDRMGRLVRSLGLRRPDDGTADDLEGARAAAARIGYPVVARLAYAQGGRAMAIVFSEADLETFLRKTLPAKDAGPVLLDRFLDYATEVDVDAVADGRDVRVVGILEHIEEAGVHSGDSACVLPPHTLAPRIIDEVARQTRAIALGLAVKGFLNVQFAIKGNDVHVLGITPRASLTAPLVARATGVPLAALAARVLLGESLVDLPAPPAGTLPYVACKEVALPFVRFPGVDPVLGPEMRSTGEVMGIDAAYGSAFLKSQLAAGQRLPTSGTVFFSLKDADKRALIPLAQRFVAMGFAVIATRGTADVFGRNGIPCQVVRKVSEGRPNIVDRVINREVALLINTPSGRAESVDEASIRKRAYSYGVPLVTTVSGAFAVADGIEALRTRGVSVRPLQEYHAAARRP